MVANRHDVSTALGLCSTCSHAVGCGYRQLGVQVLHCEEFHTDPAPPPAQPAFRHRPESVRDAVRAPTELGGLCVNCDHRLTCRIARPAGGVWHCEEYQ